MDRYAKSLPKHLQADYQQALNKRLQEDNMCEEDYKIWQAEIEAITQRIVELYEAIENIAEASSDRQRVTGSLLHGVKAMNTAKQKLFALHPGKVLA